jgi:hypothetical protein
MTPRTYFLCAAVVLFATSAHGSPYALTPADRTEIATLARLFFDSVRDGTRDVHGVYPEVADLRLIFPTPRAGARATPGPSLQETLTQHQLTAIARDAQELHSTFHGGSFVGLSARSYPRQTIDLRPCGRFARATSQCVDGPLIEYTVAGQTRRFQVDTLMRVRGHWRVFDVRP